MGRTTNFIPSYYKVEKKWVISIPPRYSSTGKREREFFDTKQQANERSKILKHLKDTRPEMMRYAGVDLVADAIECDTIAQEMGFAGLKEAFALWSAEHDRKERAPLFRELLDQWEYDHAKDWTKTYLDTRWKPFRGYFLEEHLNTSIALQDEDYWKDWMPRWQNKEFSGDKTKGNVYQKTTYNQVLSLLRAMFNQSRALKHHPVNPILGVNALKKEVGGKKREITVFSPQDAKLILYTALEHRPELVPYFAVCLFSGARPDSEAKRLTWEDIDFEQKHIRITVSKTNTMDVRYVPLEPTLEAWLAPWKGSTGLVAPTKNFRRMRDNIIKGYHTTPGAHSKKPETWKPLVDWGHDVTRHSYASYYEAAHRHEEGNRERLMYNLGHTTIKTFESNYKNARTSAEAKDFWGILPPPEAVNIKRVAF